MRYKYDLVEVEVEVGGEWETIIINFYCFQASIIRFKHLFFERIIQKLCVFLFNFFFIFPSHLHSLRQQNDNGNEIYEFSYNADIFCHKNINAEFNLN